MRNLAEEARSELVQAAWAYTRSYRDIERPVDKPGTRLILAGHQPQLFHPGVWFKNFVLDEIAKNHDGVAVNLVIDSDTIKTTSIRVPGGRVAEPIVENVAFDRQSVEIPYEARQIVDRDCLASFGRRAAEKIRPLVAAPFVESFWPLVVERLGACHNLGEVVAQRGTCKKGCGARPLTRFRRATSAICPRSIGSPATCWRGCRGCGKFTTVRWPTIAVPITCAQAPTRCPTWPRRTIGWKRRSGFGTWPTPAAVACSSVSAATRFCSRIGRASKLRLP